LLIMVDAARRATADRITAVIPFFGYARQDRKDQPRVPITAKLVANLLHAAGVSRVLTMDLDAQQVQGFFDIPVDHLYSLPVLIKYLRQQLTGKTVVVSPDLGGLKMASAYADGLGANLAIVAKERRSATETEALYLIGEVEDRDVLLVDDLTETAGTLASAAELLKKRGALKIYAGVSHAVLVDLAIPRLQKSKIEELITTNSTPVRTAEGFKTTVLCVSELLGEGIKRIQKDESVSSLFNIENETNGKTSQAKSSSTSECGTLRRAQTESARSYSCDHLWRQGQAAAVAGLRPRHQRNDEPCLWRKCSGRARNRW